MPTEEGERKISWGDLSEKQASKYLTFPEGRTEITLCDQPRIVTYRNDDGTTRERAVIPTTKGEYAVSIGVGKEIAKYSDLGKKPIVVARTGTGRKDTKYIIYPVN
jgi:hypothetical protein